MQRVGLPHLKFNTRNRFRVTEQTIEAITFIAAYLPERFPDLFPDGWVPSNLVMKLTKANNLPKDARGEIIEALRESKKVYVVPVHQGKRIYFAIKVRPGTEIEFKPTVAHLRRIEKLRRRRSTWINRLIKWVEGVSELSRPEVEVEFGKKVKIRVGDSPYGPTRVEWDGYITEDPGLERELRGRQCIHKADGSIEVLCPACKNEWIRIYEGKIYSTCPPEEIRRSVHPR